MGGRGKSAADAVSRTVGAVVRELQRMKQPEALLSGDDSGLVCVWDEICVQQQVEEFFAWPAYEVTVRAVVQGYIDDLRHRELVALWLRTDDGKDWAFDHGPRDLPAPVPDDCIECVFQAVLNRANDYTNARIRRYIDRSIIESD